MNPRWVVALNSGNTVQGRDRSTTRWLPQNSIYCCAKLCCQDIRVRQLRRQVCLQVPLLQRSLSVDINSWLLLAEGYEIAWAHCRCAQLVLVVLLLPLAVASTTRRRLLLQLLLVV
jgi:hypothetical protein